MDSAVVLIFLCNNLRYYELTARIRLLQQAMAGQLAINEIRTELYTQY